MPNYLGLLTKQEAKSLRDLNLSGHRAVIIEIAEIIRQAQVLTPDQTSSTFKRQVHDDVASFFKNEMSYAVTEDKTGQPPNFTFLISISWAS